MELTKEAMQEIRRLCDAVDATWAKYRADVPHATAKVREAWLDAIADLQRELTTHQIRALLDRIAALEAELTHLAEESCHGS